MPSRGWSAVLTVLVACAAPAAARAAGVRSGDLAALVSEPAAGRLSLRWEGRVVLREHPNRGGTRTGRLGFVANGRWNRPTRLLSFRRRAGGWTGVLATTDPAGGRMQVRLHPVGNGAIRLEASVLGRRPAEVQLWGVAFGAPPGERFLGFGERSNAVNQRGRTIENRVEEGPFLLEDYPAIEPTIPPWAIRRAADASYFPMPWLLSTRRYGVLVDNAERSRFRLGSDRRRAWSLEVPAPRLRLRFLAGPSPAALVRRLTQRTGRQPRPAAPWFLGPWFQTGHSNQEPEEQGHVRLLREGDAPVSAVETHMRYMPCGADVGLEASERKRTAAFHHEGLAALTYMREAVCATYEPVWSQGVAQGAFIRRPGGGTYSFPAFVGSGVTELAMIDFTTVAGRALFHELLARAVANGYDGWMEDYGEYVPPDAVSGSGIPGSRLRNLYPMLYHHWGERFTRRQARPLARFVRSGWTGAHHGAGIVWGGDPTTGWGFDGLRSSVTQALTMGLSGIGIWGSDIGGFFTLTAPGLDRELLHRWIQFGAVSPVMRTKAQGIVTPKSERPQVWEPQTLPLWRRYAKLHTQLYPYMSGAVSDYRRSGMPLMRHLSLAYPRDRRAISTDGQFLFGPDLLAAPVLEPGARARRVYLPRGRWVDLWRSARYLQGSGGLRLGRARVLRGGRTVRLPAPLDELPLLVRAGAVLPLLPPEVDTLAPYGGGRDFVRLADRRDRLDLLAFPRGRSSGRLGARGRWVSRLRRGSWRLSLRAGGPRRYRLQASLPGLRPRSVRLNGRRLGREVWSYDRGSAVFRAAFRGTRSTSLTLNPK
jgi:alpha-glucosidase (family GH31 glycosyl hydrolase)